MSLPQKLTFLLAALAALTEAAPPISRNKPWQQGTTGRAIYIITDEAENAVVALPIQSDGSLAAGTSTKTGGAGAYMINAASGQPVFPDPLSSQSALTLVGNVRQRTPR